MYLLFFISGIKYLQTYITTMKFKLNKKGEIKMSKDFKGTMYVHGSKFHSDDMLCAAMGRILGYEIVRTLDKDIVQKVKPQDFVVDFGRVYDGVRFFDHHQPGAPNAQECGIENRFPFAKVAAAGQFWHKYGKDVIKAIDPKVPEEVIPEIIDAVDTALIAPSDKVDTGDGDLPLGVTSLSTVVTWFNPEDQDLKKFDAAFNVCLENVVLPTLKRCIEKMLVKVYGREFVKAAPIVEGMVIVLDKYAPWQGTVIRTPKFDQCLFCVYPSLRGGWNGQVIPTSPTVNNARKDFPVEWAGLTDAEFCKAAGIEQKGQGYFCHVARFLVAAPTKEEVIKLCTKAAYA